MNVLGVHVGHDSSAALVVDGRIVADVAEERLRRIKHCAGVPTRAIAYCLQVAATHGTSIDAVAVASRGAVPPLSAWFGDAVIADVSSSVTTAQRARRIVAAPLSAPPLYARPPRFPAPVPLIHVDHHLAHAASAYFTSGFAGKQLVATLDGFGDGYSTCIWRGENGRLEPLLQLGPEASLGWFYGCVTEALGWWHGDGEGKTMGLAAFGETGRCAGALTGFHPEFSGGALIRPHTCGYPATWSESGGLHWHMAEAEAIRDLIERHGREHIAAEAQRVLEDQVAALVLPWLNKERVDALACAGGVFLNVKLNQRLWQTGLLSRQHVFPNSADAGLAAGAALQVDFQANPGQPMHRLDSVSLGPEYTGEEVEQCLSTRGLSYRRCEDPADEAARLLAQGRSVGWFQGRMESGPRALGNRSILMSAGDRRNAERLNARVKYREAFRPFCPSLTAESRDVYLQGARDEEFMTTSFPVRPSAADRVPAAVHVDGTVRPQTVRREAYPLFWRLLTRYADHTGESLLLNTSFNVAGEPLVASPRDALRTFFDSGLDCLIMHDFAVEK